MSMTSAITPRQRRWLIGAALLWFFVCLLWTAPATLFAALAQRVAPLQLDAVSGGFWHGRAGQAYVLVGPNQRMALGMVEWRLRPWSLLWLHPSAHVTGEYGNQLFDSHIRLSPTGTLALRDTRATIPLTALNHWFPLPASGVIAFDLDEAEIAGNEWRALRGEILWQQASWQWNGRWLALGDYRAVLEMPKAAQLHGAIEGKGALALTGRIDIDLREKNYDVQAQLIADDSLPRDFREGFTLLLAAQRDAKGHWAVRRQGRW